MTKNMRGVLVAGVAAVGMLSAPPLAAQDLSWSFAAEAAGDKVYVLFAEPSVVFGPDRGWRPVVHVGAHWVDNDGDNTWGVTPAVGLRYQDSGGFIQGDVGWAIADEDVNRGFDVFGGGKSGLSTGIHTEYYGSGAWGLQGIANYNWGADFLWSRARILKRVAQRSGGGAISLGAMLTWEAQTDVPGNNEYQGTFIGPVLQLTTPGGANWAFSGGYKHTQPASTTRKNNTWYVLGELYLP